MRGVKHRMKGRGFGSWLKKAARSVGRFVKKEIYNPVIKPALERSRDIAKERIMRGVEAARSGLGRRRMKGGRRRRKGMKLGRRKRHTGSYPPGSGLDLRY